ncbi:hypothetical protein EDD86DRAFT_177767, partial [Gorgonomyces haynaldii]
NFKSHYISSHLGIKPHQCQFCDRSFARLNDLKRHCRIHDTERRFVCHNMHCQKSFTRKDAITRHYQ